MCSETPLRLAKWKGNMGKAGLRTNLGIVASYKLCQFAASIKQLKLPCALLTTSEYVPSLFPTVILLAYSALILAHRWHLTTTTTPNSIIRQICCNVKNKVVSLKRMQLRLSHVSYPSYRCCGRCDSTLNPAQSGLYFSHSISTGILILNVCPSMNFFTPNCSQESNYKSSLFSVIAWWHEYAKP